MVPPRTKLSSEERRAAIIQAVRRVFAERGFHGTTTKALADAAGVSEALLFKHFPNKEALFEAMQLTCCRSQDADKFDRLHALEPSASTLILMVHFFVSRFLDCSRSEDDEKTIQNRLMLRSFAEDGEFARLALRGVAEHWVPKVNECLKVAVAAGEALPGPVQATSAAWFAHHLAAILMTHCMPEEPVVDYGLTRDKLIEQSVWFTLRGMGIKEDVIQRHYNARALALLTG
jgi:AcrR family transcriptional regulator